MLSSRVTKNRPHATARKVTGPSAPSGFARLRTWPLLMTTIRRCSPARTFLSSPSSTREAGWPDLPVKAGIVSTACVLLQAASLYPAAAQGLHDWYNGGLSDPSPAVQRAGLPAAPAPAVAAAAVGAAPPVLAGPSETPAPQVQQPGPESPSAALSSSSTRSTSREAYQLAAAAHFKVPWLLVLLGIGAVNVVGLRLVLQLVRQWQESSAPCTLVKLQFGLRCSDPSRQQKLRELGQMVGLGQQGSWVILEEFAIMLTQAKGSLVYADASSTLVSVAKGFDLFKQVAAREAEAADKEEALGVAHGVKPEAPQHRGPLGRLLGAPPTEDVEERQQCLVLTLVLAARGVLDIPTINDWASARQALQQVCGLSVSNIMGLELLWTPEDPEDFLSEAQLMADYPQLVDLRSGRRTGELLREQREAEWNVASTGEGSEREVEGSSMMRERQGGYFGVKTPLPPEVWGQQQQEVGGGQAQ